MRSSLRAGSDGRALESCKPDHDESDLSSGSHFVDRIADSRFRLSSFVKTCTHIRDYFFIAFFLWLKEPAGDRKIDNLHNQYAPLFKMHDGDEAKAK